MIHSVLLNTVNRRIYLSSGTVKICCMNMYAKRFTANHFGMNTGRICKPIVSMNQIELLTTSQYTCYNREIIYLLVEVSRVATGKSDTTQIVQPLQVIKVSIQMVAEAVIVLCGMSDKAVLNPIVVNIAPYYGNLAHIDNLEESLLFSCWARHAECCIHIAL